MDAVRKLLDPRGTGTIPRRAVILDTGLVADKTSAPHLQEVHVLSEIARALFHTEPRDPSELLRRALVLDVSAAWQALRDDMVLGPIILPKELATHVQRHFLVPNPVKTFVCATLMAAHPTYFEPLKISDVSLTAISEMNEDVQLAVQAVIQVFQPDIEIVAKVLRESPQSCRLFLAHPQLSHLPSYDKQLLEHLCEYAALLPVKQRYPQLALVAVVCQSGVRFSHDVGTHTLEWLSKHKIKFDIKLAAAAAVVAGQKCSLGPLIETLAAAVQRM